MKFVTMEQAATELNVSLRRVYQFCADGRLGLKVGNKYIITRDSLESFKQEERTPGRPPKSG